MIGLSYGNFQAVTTTPFSFGNALQFDGVNDYVVKSGGISCPLNADFTVACWVKRNSLTSPQYPRILDMSDGTYNFQLLFGGTGATDNIIHTKNTVYQGGLTSTAHGSALSLSTWYCVVVSYTHSGNVINTYIDGVLASSSAGEVVGSASVTSSFNLGTRNDGISVTFLNGILDELGVKAGYAATLTDAQNFYNGGSGANFLGVFGSGQVNYHFNESGTDTTAVDSSGNGNDGTLNNFSTPPAYFIPH